MVRGEAEIAKAKGMRMVVRVYLKGLIVESAPGRRN